MIASVVVLSLVSCAAAAGSDWSADQHILQSVEVSVEADWNSEFYADYWPGVCATGQSQSPLNLKHESSLLPVPQDLVTTWQMPLVHEPIIKHTGHAIEVCVCSNLPLLLGQVLYSLC